MSYHLYRYAFRGFLLVIALASLFGSANPAAAATGSITANPALNIVGATCGASAVGFSFSMTATVDDFGIPPGFDMVSVVLFDGKGNALSAVNTAGLSLGTIASFNSSLSLNGITARPVTVQLIDTSTAVFTPPVPASFAGKPVLGSIIVDPASFAPACASLPLTTGNAIFTDGRINNRAEDAAQTAAIYCTGDGGVTIWAVNNSVGKFAFTATKAEIDKVPANPAQNTLIKQALSIALYRLHGGKLQVNAPNGYVYIWDGC